MGTLNTIRSGASAMAEDIFLQDITDLLTSGGVKDLGSDDHLKVTERGAGANMSVDVETGRAFVLGSSGNAYPVQHTGSVSNVTITANTSGSTRVDAIVVWIDTAATPDSTASNVAKLKAVVGTSASALSDAAIQTDLGAGIPFLRLANVTVVNGASSIEDDDISDARAAFSLRGLNTDGWTTVIETWTRTGNHQFTISGSGDLTSKYTPGTKVRYKDGGSYEYGYVLSSSYSNPTNTITLFTNADYEMANTTITDTAISYEANPAGFPDWFDYVVTWGGFSSAPTGVTSRFCVKGRTCQVHISPNSPGTSNSTSLTISLPATSANLGTNQRVGWGQGENNGSTPANPAMAILIGSTATATVYRDAAGTAWTASGTKAFNGMIIYEF